MKLESAFDLSYADIGDKDAPAVFYMHGLIGSYLDLSFIPKMPQWRLIAINRPGRSSSKFVKHSTILQFTHSIKQIADHLCLKRFGVLGFSGGSPFAIACAKAFPERLLFIKDISGWPPFDFFKDPSFLSKKTQFTFSLAANAPLLSYFTLFFTSYASKAYDDLRFSKLLRPILSEGDANWLNLHVKELKLSTAESFKRSINGAFYEMSLYKKKWGFSLDEIDYPIELYHGLKDVICPPPFASYKKSLLKNSTLTFYEESGHLDILDLIPKICQ